MLRNHPSPLSNLSTKRPSDHKECPVFGETNDQEKRFHFEEIKGRSEGLRMEEWGPLKP